MKNGRVWIDTAALAADSRRCRNAFRRIDYRSRRRARSSRCPDEEFATKDSELLACDVECRLAGIEGFYLELDIPGLNELIGGAR